MKYIILILLSFNISAKCDYTGDDLEVYVKNIINRINTEKKYGKDYITIDAVVKHKTCENIIDELRVDNPSFLSHIIMKLKDRDFTVVDYSLWHIKGKNLSSPSLIIAW